MKALKEKCENKNLFLLKFFDLSTFIKITLCLNKTSTIILRVNGDHVTQSKFNLPLANVEFAPLSIVAGEVFSRFFASSSLKS